MKRFSGYTIFAFLSTLTYFQITFFQSKIFGFIIFIILTLFLTKIWKAIFTQLLPQEDSIVVKGISFLMAFSITGWVAAVFVAWYTLNPILVSLATFLSGIFSLELLLKLQKKVEKQNFIEDLYTLFPSFSPPGILPAVYLLVYLIAFSVLLSPAQGILHTPWQSLPEIFLYLFFLLTILLGILVLSHLRPQKILFFVILHSILLHSYLPLSHQLPWGGDVWKVIAVEEKISAGDSVLPVLFGKEVKWREFGPLSVPEALIIPHKYVYSHLWGESTFLSKILQIDLLQINRFLVPFFWSLLVPILTYALGKLLFQSDKKGIIFSFLTFLPFPLQALGGLTLASSWGFPIFLFLLYLWFSYLQNRNTALRNVVFILGILSFFGYTLYFILLWFIIITSLLLQKISNKQKLKNMFWIIVSIIGIFLFPIIELLLHVSKFPSTISWLQNFKQIIGQWSGWYFASAIRPHDILSGNIIFNHTPFQSFVENIFTTNRWHIMAAMFLLFAGTLFGLYATIKEKRLEWKMIGTLLIVTFGGYIIGWYILEGERSFVRRLDPILAFLLLVVSLYGIFTFFEKKNLKKRYLKVMFIFFLLFVSWTTITIYASGPDMRVVSTSEYNAATFIAEVYNRSSRPCILADTWVLLVVEGVTKGEIVGGGFPIDQNFGQKERVELYQKLLSRPEEFDPQDVSQFTGSNECLFVIPQNAEKYTKISQIFGTDFRQVEDISIWHLHLKKEGN